MRAHELLQDVRDHSRVELAADRAAQIAELGDGHGRVRVADDVALARDAGELGLRVRDVAEVRDVGRARASELVARCTAMMTAAKTAIAAIGARSRAAGDSSAVGFDGDGARRRSGAARRGLRRGHATCLSFRETCVRATSGGTDPIVARIRVSSFKRVWCSRVRRRSYPAAGFRSSERQDLTCLTRTCAVSDPASCSCTRCVSEATRSAGRTIVTHRSRCSTRTSRRAATSSTPPTPTRPGSTGTAAASPRRSSASGSRSARRRDDLIVATKVGSGAEDVPKGLARAAGHRRLRGLAAAPRRRADRPLLRPPRRSGDAARGDARRVRRARARRQGGAHRRLQLLAPRACARRSRSARRTASRPSARSSRG